MSRRLVILLAAFAAVVLFPTGVSAHVLIKDRVGDTGAILHLNPDDDPIAGQQASLFFDIRDASISSETSQAKLTVTDGQGTVATVSSELAGSSVSANYVFPRQGLYEVKLVITRDGKTTHTFLQSQRVSRGIIGSVSAHSAPAWAEIGLLFTLLAAALTAIIAFNRRKKINQYSKR